MEDTPVGNVGSARLGVGKSGTVPRGSTTVGNPDTTASGGSGPIPGQDAEKPNQ